MRTEIQKLNGKDPGKEPDATMIQKAAALIQAGSLVAFPTETVYGLGADAMRADASKKIYEAKGRPSDNPLIVHIADIHDLERLADPVTEKARKLADAFWPGPLTIILKKKDSVPKETTGGLGTVAVRMPSHPVALALIKASGRMIAAPSANTSGRPSPTRAEHVWEDLHGKVPMILDGGEVGIGIESTIIDLSEDVPMILRPGYVTEAMLRRVIGEVRIDPGILAPDSSARPKAPGMKYRHYAPKAQLFVVTGEQRDVVEKIGRLVEEQQSAGKKVGVIATDETAGYYLADDVQSVGARGDEDVIARHLYDILRGFDDTRVDVIYSESFDSLGFGKAIMNRLLKAAGHCVIEA